MLAGLNSTLGQWATAFSDFAWGPWLLVLLLGGGLFFLSYSRLVPFRYLGHGYALMRGKFSQPGAPGQITHFQALCSALAGTIGMGNIAGVALAVHAGGPGAVFWMWMTAVVGIATKFFTCTLAVMYRGPDSSGELQGGPMYVIREALPRLKPLAYLFAIAGLLGCLPAFQANQLVQILRDVVFIDNGWIDADDAGTFNVIMGISIALLVAPVVLGGLPRVASAAARVVPTMTVLYVATAAAILILNISALPGVFALIVSEAFNVSAAGWGGLAGVILIGVQRGAYSNEAGIGTESMAHGAARTAEPVREGLVAMLGPIIDTLIICSMTAFVILLSGVWQNTDANGVTMTSYAFTSQLGSIGSVLLFVCVASFALSTMCTYSYYGTKCAGFLFGAERQHWYRYLYLIMIVAASVVDMHTAIGFIDGSFAIMAVPTMISTLILAPRVMAAARDYFTRLPTMVPSASVG